jgi:hypothetical protein
VAVSKDLEYLPPATFDRHYLRFATMSFTSEVLLIEAKRAILEDHLRQYQLMSPRLSSEERLLQLQRTLHSAAGLLQDSLSQLGRIGQSDLGHD